MSCCVKCMGSLGLQVIRTVGMHCTQGMLIFMTIHPRSALLSVVPHYINRAQKGTK